MDYNERNDALAKVDCKIKDPCCGRPAYINQFGSRTCICINCRKRCIKCIEHYLKK